MARIKGDPSLEERFWKNVKIKTNRDCWNWTASRTDGYGTIYNNKKANKAHRVSWIIHFGEIPDGLCVLHTCDNPSCVNPSHLFLGTRKDNNNDRDKKGRFTKMKGEENPTSKLTKQDVLEIREIYANGETNQHELAEKYNVSNFCIFDVVHRRSWAWLE